MKLFNSVFVLVATIITVSAFAGTSTRKPAASGVNTCGTAAHAAHLAATQAEEDTNSKKCTVIADPIEGPAGSFRTTYHVTLNCDGKPENYDAESNFMGMPEHLSCTSTVGPAGQFAAHAGE